MHCGFHVVSLIADNHSVNRSFFNSLSNSLHEPCINPFDQTKKLYLLIDTVHTVKNLYNNFQKRSLFTFHDACDFPTANFNDIKKMYTVESSSSLRLAYKLNERVLYPTNIQRTSAKLSMAVFDDSTVAAMKYYAEHGHEDWDSTSCFVHYISVLVKILNVRSSTVGIRRHDVMKLPISSTSDERLNSLLEYANFFKQWRESKRAGLTTETSIVVENLCRNMNSLIIHLLSDLNFRFVLTGQLTSDSLESRFGRYRQMSGGNYYISVKQVIESEKN